MMWASYPTIIKIGKDDFMKRFIAVLCCITIFSFGLNCFALSSNEVKANLITSQGKTGIVKEYSSFATALDNAKNGDTIELIGNNTMKNEIVVNKNIVVATGEKRNSNIIIGNKVSLSDKSPVNFDNVKMENNGEKHLITFKNIYVNGSYITETGDVNVDNAVDLRDLVGIKKSLVKTEDYEVKIDLNLDSSVDAKDVIILTSILLNKYI